MFNDRENGRERAMIGKRFQKGTKVRRGMKGEKNKDIGGKMIET